jgi:dTDP-4-dehydrorhamnose 3,5-epimerase
MDILKTEIDDVLILEPRVFGDHRGWFTETYSKTKFQELGIEIEFVQDNQSFSQKGVVRGLHFQKPPFAQTKLIRVIKGSILDVAVDIRKSSPTFGKWVGVELSEANHRQFWIPPGFAHGFLTLSESAITESKSVILRITLTS